MRTTALRVACLGLIVAGSGLIVASAKATGSPQEPNNGCSLATLDGFYVFSAVGFDVTADEKLAVAGYEVYDGNGKVHGRFTISQGGAIARDLLLTGSYTVKPDCSSTLTIKAQGSNVEQHFDQFIMPSGKEFRWIETDPGIVLAGDERKSE
jgi:hypothetical protein